jgi:hypothetical protein
MGIAKNKKMDLTENSYRLVLTCGAEKCTSVKEDISSKTAEEIRFLRTTVGRAR